MNGFVDSTWQGFSTCTIMIRFIINCLLKENTWVPPLISKAWQPSKAIPYLGILPGLEGKIHLLPLATLWNPWLVTVIRYPGEWELKESNLNHDWLHCRMKEANTVTWQKNRAFMNSALLNLSQKATAKGRTSATVIWKYLLARL